MFWQVIPIYLASQTTTMQMIHIILTVAKGVHPRRVGKDVSVTLNCYIHSLSVNTE